MPRLPLHAPVKIIASPLLARFRSVFERSLIEQSAMERLGKAAFASALLLSSQASPRPKADGPQCGSLPAAATLIPFTL